MEFAAHRVLALPREFAHLIITQFFIGDEQQKKPVLLAQSGERLLNARAQFLGFQHLQRVAPASRRLPERGIA